MAGDANQAPDDRSGTIAAWGIVAALASTAISFFALNRFRQETVDVVEDRVEKRRARAQQMREAEDVEED